ncbi:MAG TPA: hypothetical protein VL263_01065 [Vicinamibacterales bacterium]|jgi:hypothetical protein|nr:hypothetical protein [Vicinamibacterales bacterium]
MRVIGATVAAAVLALAAAGAQAPAAPGQKPAPRAGAVPRTADGKPDLQGNWTNATITPFERLGQGRPLVLTEEQARDDETKTKAAIDAREQDSDPNRSAPPVGGEARKSPNAEPTYLERVWQVGAGVVGGYNAFWIAPGESVLRVDGQPRSSIIIDPPDGRVPAYTAAARERIAAVQAARKAAGGEFDHPELRPLGERCITSFGNNAGPPMLPNYFYNNNYQIVQSKDAIIILTEMVHDARVVRMSGTHPPPSVRKWFGDSIGRWEGDTLVIETTNFYQQHGFRNSWENLKVVERLNRRDANTINYRFTVEDPTTFATPFTGELVFSAMAPGEQVYEYACHEANYGLEGVLRGARAQEAEAARKPR